MQVIGGANIYFIGGGSVKSSEGGGWKQRMGWTKFEKGAVGNIGGSSKNKGFQEPSANYGYPPFLTPPTLPTPPTPFLENFEKSNSYVSEKIKDVYIYNNVDLKRFIWN